MAAARVALLSLCICLGMGLMLAEQDNQQQQLNRASYGAGAGSSSYGSGSSLGGGGYGGGSGYGSGGCSSNYWAEHADSWPSLLTIYTTVTQALGELAYTIFGGPTTLLSALQSQGTDPYSTLFREATAALLNSYSRPSFQYSPDAVRSAFNSGLRSKQAAAIQAAKFYHANNAGYGTSSSCT